MDRTKIFQAVDHTLLAQTATWEEIRQICDDALACHTASVCIPPSYVKRAAEYLAGRMAVCTVIGFPNGYQTTAVKTGQAALDEIGRSYFDMVIAEACAPAVDGCALVRSLRASSPTPLRSRRRSLLQSELSIFHHS